MLLATCGITASSKQDAAPPVGTPITQAMMPYTIASDGAYYVAENLTAAGAAITISTSGTTSGVTINGNNKLIDYNTGDTAGIAGIHPTQAVTDVTIYNCKLRHQGVTADNCKGIRTRGATWLIYNNSIDDVGLNGIFTCIGNTEDGIYDCRSMIIHDNFLVAGGGDGAATSAAPRGIHLEDRSSDAYCEIYNNIVAEAQWPIGLNRWGYTVAPTVRSLIYSNSVMGRRIENVKGPYGISVSSISRNIDIYRNRVTTDNGRGVYLSGDGQGSSDGTTNCTVTENAIGCNFYTASKHAGVGGTYTDFDNYGVRCRYHSGNNTLDDNYIHVQNQLTDSGAKAMSTFIGSDLSDVDMVNLVTSNNTTIAWAPATTGYVGAWFWDDLEDVTITNNAWRATGGGIGDSPAKDLFEWNNDAPVGSNDRRVSVTETGTTAYAPTDTGTPAVVGTLSLVKHLDSYYLSWPENTEEIVDAYIVYIDSVATETILSGKRPHASVPDPFYVAFKQAGTVTFEVSAVTIYGDEGAKSAGISTTNAVDGW